jgi:hypothetical protein
MNIVATVEQRDRTEWENDTDGFGYISESNRIGWEIGRLVSAIYEEPEMWDEYRRSTQYIGLSGLVKLAEIHGIPVEIGDTWIRFGPGPRWLVLTVNFTVNSDVFVWKATVEKSLD